MGAKPVVYDAKKISINLNNVLITGFSEGTFVSCEQDEEFFSQTVSAQGDVGVAVKNAPTGTITLTLAQTSPSLSYVSTLANSGQMFPIWVTSNNTVKEKIGGTSAMIKKMPNVEFSDEISDREVEIQVFDYQHVITN